MYQSKYYTCEEIDERLLKGYYDDAVSKGYPGTLDQFKLELASQDAVNLDILNNYTGYTSAEAISKINELYPTISYPLTFIFLDKTYNRERRFKYKGAGSSSSRRNYSDNSNYIFTLDELNGAEGAIDIKELFYETRFMGFSGSAIVVDLGYYCGQLTIFGDNMGDVINQVLITNNLLSDDGTTITSSHRHTRTFQYERFLVVSGDSWVDREGNPVARLTNSKWYPSDYDLQGEVTENTKKLSELDGKAVMSNDGEDSSDLDIADDGGNVLARFFNGHFRVKNFNSQQTVEKIANIIKNSGIEAFPEFSEEEDYSMDDIVRKDGLMYKFTTEHEAGEWNEEDVEQTDLFTELISQVEHPVYVVDGEDSSDLDIADDGGNVLARFADGHLMIKNFDSRVGGSGSKYARKRCSILGDSISTYGVPGSTNTEGTYTYPGNMCRYSQNGSDSIKFNVEDTWWMRVIKDLGMTLGINESWRGTTVSTARGEDTSFSNQTRINHLEENGTPDLIIVYGGTNDAGAKVNLGTFNTENPMNYTTEQIATLPAETFADGYRTMLIRLMKKYPMAEIVAVLPTLCTSYYTITNLDLYVEVAREACDFFGIKWIDIRTAGLKVYNLNSYLVDGIHPNAAGHKLLAEKIEKQLLYT